tara:strand:+ start:2598 stop:2918 length:321 start_codon:yes stop_codon:yes gene_type:complete
VPTEDDVVRRIDIEVGPSLDCLGVRKFGTGKDIDFDGATSCAFFPSAGFSNLSEAWHFAAVHSGLYFMFIIFVVICAAEYELARFTKLPGSEHLFSGGAKSSERSE